MTQLNISSAALRRGTAISILSAISFASAVIFIRHAYQAGILPVTAVFLRFTIAAITLVLFLILSGQWTKLPGRQAGLLFLLGFVAYTTLGTTWVIALSITPAWLVSLIIAMYPLCVSISSWIFLKEPVRRQQLIALATVLLGGIALSWRPFEGVAWSGILLMIFNVMINTAYILVGQRWTRGIPPAMSAAWLITGAMFGTFLYALLSHQISFAFAPIGWLWATFFALISTVLAILTLWWGISLIGPTRAAIIGSFEPLCSILFAVLLLGERLWPLQIVGGVLILIGVLLVQWNHP